MSHTDTIDQAALRTRLRAFLDEHCPGRHATQRARAEATFANQDEAAQAAGVSRVTFHNILSGQRVSPTTARSVEAMMDRVEADGPRPAREEAAVPLKRLEAKVDRIERMLKEMRSLIV